MIPVRVEVKGFLCYRDAQVIDLDACDLWAFTGRNGSGKSAIFDAMTFALFGRHRGGAYGAENLIHSDASEFVIIFDFDLGAERYRIRRSLRRGGRSERQVHRRGPDGDGDDRWPSEPETDSDAGLKRWVEENVGLSFEMFTSSVLLRQGEADKLLSADPAERFKILAGVVDLARYQRLHGLADDRRRRRRARADELRAQHANAPKVDPAAVAEAEARLADAASALVSAAAERERLADAERQAESWLQLSGWRADAVARRDRARGIIAESAAIVRDRDRLRELDAIMPALGAAIDRREEVAAAASEAEGREAVRADLADKLDRMRRLADDQGRRIAGVDAEIGRDEARRRAILDRLSALAEPIARARSARSRRGAIASLEADLAAYPAGLVDEVDRMEEDRRLRQEWKAALPSLAAFDASRRALARARARVGAGGPRVALAEAKAGRLTGLLAEREVRAKAALAASRVADSRRTGAETTQSLAEARLRAFEQMEGEKACDRCGQGLTPDHFARESAHLRAERDAARARARDAGRDARDVAARASAAEAQRAEAEADLRSAEVSLRDARRDLDQAGRDANAAADACATAFGEMEDSFRLAIDLGAKADWLATTFPTPADLDEGRRRRDGLIEAERRLKAARSQADAMREIRARLTEAVRALEETGLEPGDEAAEADHSRLAAEAEAIDRCLEDHRAERATADEEGRRLAELVESLEGQISDVDGDLMALGARIEARWGESARARAAAPESWRAAFDGADRARFEGWESERRSLVDRDTEALFDELSLAEASARRAEADIDGFNARIAGLPEHVRRAPDAIAAEMAEAVARHGEAEGARLARKSEFDTLRNDLKARGDLETRLLDANRDLAVADTLARFLGRDGLQRELLRGAERDILEFARPILRDVSGGELDLQLAGGGREEADGEHALALEALVRTSGSTRKHDLAYLSGSQKFRVAVSLALAIGQYARGLDRPIRSVIIDEGFGCLDRQGRDEMIAELNRLKGRLDRIILVSHQEEFADAFRDGYHFEVKEGTTVAKAFHR